MISDLLYL